MSNYESLQSELLEALASGFVNNEDSSFSSLEPQFVYNSEQKHRKVYRQIIQELNECVSFSFSVAFITRSGYQVLLESLKEALERGVKGRILTTDYLSFTDPDVLLDIERRFPNIELRVYPTFDQEGGFHTKGYIFEEKKKNETLYKLIIGSSNLTDSALSKNQEWNTEFVSTKDGKMVKEILSEFSSLWEKAAPLHPFIEQYKRIYEEQKEIALARPLLRKEEYLLKPNAMQTRFVESLQTSFLRGDKRGLLISATGTGKTYASAFGIRELKPKRVLFLAHRTNLLAQAIRSYQTVFPLSKRFAIFSGDKKQIKNLTNVTNFEWDKMKEYDFVFATRELFGKEENYSRFPPSFFDFVVIDEAHHVIGSTYRKILNHLNARYILGMTATPETTVNPEAVYETFDHNVLFEIRLQDALEENLLCSFHYYGVKDVGWADDKLYETKEFARYFDKERVDLILEKSRFYGYSGSRVKGLIFVSGKEDGRALEKALKERGEKVAFLCGEDDALTRERTISLLEKEDISDGEYLSYIITVDIFNEGVDIPSINQVLLLRPTESTIVFIQQLGRGLRHFKTKDFVVIVDFIGNYKNNFMIAKAFAFGGDKDEARMRVVNLGDLPGISTIEFDEIAKREIFASLAKTSFNTFESFANEFIHLANKLYRLPSYDDFLSFSDFDPLRIIKKYDSYYVFLRMLEKRKRLPDFIKELPKFSDEEEFILKEAGLILGAGIRKEEPLLLLTLIEGGSYGVFLNRLLQEGIVLSEQKKRTILNLLKGNWLASLSKTTSHYSFIGEDNELNPELKVLLNDEDFYQELHSLVEFYLERNKRFYSHKYKDTDFVLNAQYSYREISQLFNYEKDYSSVLNGYKYDKKNDILPIFINYDKAPDLDERTSYKDKFLDPKFLAWESRAGEKENGTLANCLRNKKTKIYLFVRKTNYDKETEAKKFYFLGEASCIGPVVANEKTLQGQTKKLSYIDVTLKLENEARNDIYSYFQSSLKEDA